MEEPKFVFEADDGTFEAGLPDVERLAAEGNPAGMYALGFCCLFGHGMEQDKGRGYELLERSAEAGNQDAKVLLCRMFLERDYYGLDPEKAMQYARDGAEAGIPEGMLYYGYALSEGIGGEQDYAGALKWFRKASNMGSMEAKYNLGYLYVNGLGTEPDEKKGYTLARQSADGGSVEGMKLAGMCLESGIGTPRDPEKAEKYYRSAAEKGDSEAYFLLANLKLEDGDLHECFELFLNSAMGGFPPAMTMVGRMYADAAGVERDKEEAKKWLALAKDSGDPEAERYLSALK